MPHDKKLHLFAGYAVAWLAGIGCMATGLPLWPAPLAAAIAGLGKEVWDSQGHGDPDFMDFIASASGGLLAYGMIALIMGRL